MKENTTIRVWRETANKIRYGAELDNRTQVQFVDNIISKWLDNKNVQVVNSGKLKPEVTSLLRFISGNKQRSLLVKLKFGLYHHEFVAILNAYGTEALSLDPISFGSQMRGYLASLISDECRVENVTQLEQEYNEFHRELHLCNEDSIRGQTLMVLTEWDDDIDVMIERIVENLTELFVNYLG